MASPKIVIISNNYVDVTMYKNNTFHNNFNALKVALEVKNKLISLGADVLMSETGDFPNNISDNMLKISDVVIVLGGDGTIIHTAKRAAIYKKPVLGINCGNLGFMAGLEADELDKLELLFSENFSIERFEHLFQRRMMLEVILKRQDKKEVVFSALNEVTISGYTSSKMTHFDIYNKREKVISYNADGIILSTPTGSTAYSLSAGGPIVDPEVNCILFTPVCAHSLFARSYIFSEKDEISVLSKKRNNDETIYLFVDGEDGINVSQEDIITVRKSELYANILTVSEKPFYKMLNNKLIYRK